MWASFNVMISFYLLPRIHMANNDRYEQAKKVTLIGALCNALLGVSKLIGGYFFHSHALIADGVHSFSDLFTDMMVLFASKYGSHDADESHPYGHQRIETAATLFLSLLLCLAGFSIALDACKELLYDHFVVPGWPSLIIISCSILINEGLFHYTQYIGKRINSSLIMANAWHHRSDAGSSVVVLVGILGSLAGVPILDALAATIVGIMIIKMGWDYGWNSVRELVDTAVEPKMLQHIEETIQKVHGVKKIHQLRTRFMGNDILIDVHIIVESTISVSEGHYIAQNVHHVLATQLAHVKDVIVHVDHEDDELCSPSLRLPSRTILQEQGLDEILKEYPDILFWNLHYLNGTIVLDIVCKEHFLQRIELHKKVQHTLEKLNLKEIRLFSLHEITKESAESIK